MRNTHKTELTIFFAAILLALYIADACAVRVPPLLETDSGLTLDKNGTGGDDAIITWATGETATYNSTTDMLDLTMGLKESDIYPFFQGTFRESFDALALVDAGTPKMSLEQAGTGDLTMRFNDGNTILDCTPILEVEMTAGSDASPQANFVYIPQSTKVLTVSTSAWPSGAEHIKVAYFLLPSAGRITSDGPYITQNWNDHADDANRQGHLSHMTQHMREEGAHWFSGVAANGTSSYLTIVGATVDLKATAGVVSQMHHHTFPAFDTSSGDEVLVVNWSGDAYHNITNLFDIVADSTGAAITNQRWLNLTVWGAANKTGQPENIFINLPAGVYVTQAAAEADADGFDDLTVPREFGLDSSTGFLIARLTIQKQAGTWVHGSTVDLRGTMPSAVTGGGVGATVTEFPDNQFLIFDDSDVTKKVDFQASGITAGNTRTMTIPDKDVTIADVADYTTLIDNSMADTKHRHSELSASDGTPDASWKADTAGVLRGTTKIVGTAAANEFGDNTNISPTASGDGYIQLDANGYDPYWTADGTAMYIGHNTGSRNFVLQTNETDRLTLSGNGLTATFNTQTTLNLGPAASNVVLNISDGSITHDETSSDFGSGSFVVSQPVHGIGLSYVVSGTIDFNDVAAQAIASVADGYAVTDVYVEITTTFDGAAPFIFVGIGGATNGFASTPGGVLGYFEEDTAGRGAFLWDGTGPTRQIFTSADTVDALFSTGGGASQGEATIYVVIQRLK